MTGRQIPPNESGPTGDPDLGIDLSALVADHNESRSADSPSTPNARRSRPSGAGGGGVGSSRWWRVGYPVVIGAALVVLLPALVFTGLRVILDSTDGQLVKRVTDPNAPGYEAVVTKTPTAVVAMVAPDGTLGGAAVLALTSDSSGGVLTMPPTLAYSTDFGLLPIDSAWARGGVDGLADAVGKVLDLSFTEKVVVNASDWASFMSTTGPLAMTIPDPVRDANDAVVFAKGNVQVKPDQIGTFLTSIGPRENVLNRTLRQEVFWKAWLTQLRTSGTQLPGPTLSGLGRFVAALGRGQVSVSSLPVTALPPAPPLPQRYGAVKEPAEAAVASIVPFPDGAPGGRPRMRVLDGTGRLGNGITAAIQVNAAGGQTDVVGNAKSFGQSTTKIIYFEGTTEQKARAMRDALGVGEIVASKESNSASDITVILGEDYLAKYGPTSGVSTPTGG